MSAAACGLTGIEVLDVGLLSLPLQRLPSDGFRFLHLELHLTGERKEGSDGGNLRRGGRQKEATVFSQTCGGIKIAACGAVRGAGRATAALPSLPQHR